MTKTKRNTTASAADAFHRHYASIWGEERWRNSLYPSLLQPTTYTCLLNRYSPLNDAEQRLQGSVVATQPLLLPSSDSADRELKSNCYIRIPKVESASDYNTVSIENTKATFPPPEPSSNGLLSHWNLDAASVLVARLLNIQPGDKVLDLCAAPGGKSVALAQRLWPHLHADNSSLKERSLQDSYLQNGYLHSNETDGRRQRRLADNLEAYLPKVLFDSGQVVPFKIDGTSPKAEHGLRVKTPSGAVAYDKVLVDAPCSSERHIIHSHAKAVASGRIAEEMATWRPGSSKRLAKTQIDLLMTGLKVVKINGTVVYATCSIEPTENDDVVEKVVAQVEKERKKGATWSIKVGLNAGEGNQDLENELERTWAERTKYGWIALPDHPSGGKWGPLFFTMITKVKG